MINKFLFLLCENCVNNIFVLQFLKLLRCILIKMEVVLFELISFECLLKKVYLKLRMSKPVEDLSSIIKESIE